MQYGKRGSDLSLSKIELLQLGEFQKPSLPTESAESLDSFLPQFHCANREQLEIEHKIVLYLRQLGIQFKTDPRKKELDYQENSKKNVIVFQESIEEESPKMGFQRIQKISHQPKSSVSCSGDFNAWLNPVLARKRQTQEI